MAYFEYGYVNTGYDENSAEPPVSSEYNVVSNIVYNIFDVVSEKIVDLNYDVQSGSSEESISEFMYNITAELDTKIVDLHMNIFGNFHHAGIDIVNSVELPVFEHAALEVNYNIGSPAGETVLFVIRKNEND